MPKKIEKKLKQEAKKKGLKGKRAARYIYGTLSKVEKAQKRRKKK